MTTPTAAPTRMTVEEFTAKYESVHHVHAELVNGVVQEIPLPWPKHGYLCQRIGRLIGNHVEDNDLGRVMSNDSWIRTGIDSVRGADICYFSYERLPRGEMPEGLLPVVPELVIEVRSPSDRWPRIMSKGSEYLEAGVRVVAILDPSVAAVTVYRLEAIQQVLHNSDVWTLPDVLPGFSVVVERLFA